MYSYIKTISKRCHRSATQRGKDTSCVGCLKYLHRELTEYWRARDEGCVAYHIEDLAAQVMMELPREEYIAYYDDHIHNTTLDELADILITAASYYEAARQSLSDEGENISGRAIDEMIINGAVHFIYTQIQSPADMAQLRRVLLLKMLYNELRND